MFVEELHRGRSISFAEVAKTLAGFLTGKRSPRPEGRGEGELAGMTMMIMPMIIMTTSTSASTISIIITGIDIAASACRTSSQHCRHRDHDQHQDAAHHRHVDHRHCLE